MAILINSSHTRTVTPSTVRGIIGKKWPSLSGNGQQDSHELMRCLLDSLRSEDIRRLRTAVMATLGVRGEEASNLDDDTKARVKSFARNTGHSIVDEVFGGKTTSRTWFSVFMVMVIL